jgi:hypothetical protein
LTSGNATLSSTLLRTVQSSISGNATTATTNAVISVTSLQSGFATLESSATSAQFLAVNTSANATVTAAVTGLGLSSSIVGTSTISANGSRLCICPPWQNIYDWSCGWIKDQQSCVTVQQLPFPFTIPVFRFYDLALATSSHGSLWTYNTTLMPLYNVAATLTTTYTYSQPNAVAFSYPPTAVYLFENDGTLVTSWNPSTSLVNAYITWQTLTSTFTPTVTLNNAFKSNETLVLQWRRGSCD